MHDRSGSHVPIATSLSTQVAQKRARPQGTNATPFRRPVRHTSQQSTACVVGACTRRRGRCDAVAFSSSSSPSSLDESSSRGNSAPVCAHCSDAMTYGACIAADSGPLYSWRPDRSGCPIDLHRLSRFSGTAAARIWNTLPRHVTSASLLTVVKSKSKSNVNLHSSSTAKPLG